jgi:DNA end-binding protein Ku
MHWPDEIRSPEELLPPPVELTDEEIEGALALMDSMTRDDLEGDEFRDAYTEAVEQIIEAKREHREPPKLEEPEEKTGQLVDLMAALNESVQQARASRGEDADIHELPKKKTAKKQPAKKTTAKTTKAAAKKTSGRRPRSA